MALTTKESDTYQVSARVKLEPGDMFRVTGGPYYLLRDETGKRVKSSMAAKGPFRFHSYNERGRKKWIVAFSKKEGGYVALPLTRWKTVDLDNFVNRPYKVTSKMRPKR